MSAVGQPAAKPRWAVIKDARRHQRRRQRRVLAMIAALLVAAAACWQILSHSHPGDGRASGLPALGGVRQVPIDGTLLDTTAMGANLWVLTCTRLREQGATCGAGALTEIHAASGRTVLRTHIAHPTALTGGDGSIWITHLDTDDVTRVNPRTGQTTATIHLRLAHPISSNGWRRFVPSGISFDVGQVTVSSGLGFLAKINPRTVRVTRTVWTNSEATSTTTANGRTWIADELAGVGTLTPKGTRVAPRQISWAGQPLTIDNIARGAGLIWAWGSEDSLTKPSTQIGVVTTIDPRTGRTVRQWPVAANSTMVVTSHATYVGETTHVRVLTAEHSLRTLHTPKIVGLIAATPHALWASTPDGHLLQLALAQR